MDMWFFLDFRLSFAISPKYNRKNTKRKTKLHKKNPEDLIWLFSLDLNSVGFVPADAAEIALWM